MKERLKTTIFLGLIAAILFVSGLLALSVPGHFYQKAITEGVSSPLLSLRKLPRQFYSSSRFEFKKMKEVSFDDQEMWKSFHFSDYEIPFPVHHPLYLTVPIISWENKKTQLGYKLLNHRKKEVASVRFLGFKKLKFDFKENKIFQLPIFKSGILAKGSQSLWKDLFTMDIERERNISYDWKSDILKDWEKTLKIMIKRLFIIHNRVKFFPIATREITYWSDRNLGVVRVEDQESRSGRAKQYYQEVVYLLHKNQVHAIEIRTLNEDQSAEVFRRRFFNGLKYRMSSPDNSIHLYNDYKRLSYRQRLDQEGMVYLFSAWTHSLENRKYLQEMIFFLERGRQNSIHIQPLYGYGYERWGNSFSNQEEILKETEEEKLKRKIAEEFEKDMSIRRSENFVETDGDFSDKKTKVKFFLNRAKIKNSNIDEEDNVLVEE